MSKRVKARSLSGIIKNTVQYVLLFNLIVLLNNDVLYASKHSLVATATEALPSGGVKGKVFESGTNEPLIGANVVIKGTLKGVATDVDGGYTLRNVEAGLHILEVSYLSFKTKEVEVMIEDGQMITLDIYLEWEGVQGEEVTITAQARGQVAAINEQLSSNTIANVVSKDRIQELPDVNAAESIGRLPGIAIQRSGGEANKVLIRGLNPKFSTVTVNGVRIPSTGGDDRSVDLSLVSSSMLNGIEVKKAITPDMDADAIAGSVDLKLREAPEDLIFNVTAQGGYTQLQKYYQNYKVTGMVSNRVFDNKLGFMATLNADQYDRSADQLNAAYNPYRNPLTDEYDAVSMLSVNAQEYSNIRTRTGGSLVLDYRLPHGKLAANTFYNRLHNEGGVRTFNIFNIQTWGRVGNNVNINENNTSIFTSGLSLEQDFGWIQIDAGVSRTSSLNKNPRDYYAEFRPESSTSVLVKDSSLSTQPPLWPSDTLGVRPIDVLPFVSHDSSLSRLGTTNINTLRQEEVNYTAQLDFKLPFDIGTSVNGYVKFGGKVRSLSRESDRNQRGKGNWAYISYDMNEDTGDLNADAELLKCIYDQTGLINGYNVFVDQVLAGDEAPYTRIPVHYFNTNYSRNNFLTGEGGNGFPMGFTPGLSDMQRFINAADNCTYNNLPALQEDINASRADDYRGNERYDAAYIMSEINLGKYVTLIPGIRWEHDYSNFETERFSVSYSNSISTIQFLDTLNVTRNFDFFLPMVHLQIDPAEWLKLRVAYTETLARPDYTLYIPRSNYIASNRSISANNSLLSPSESQNLDFSASIYENHIGLFTFSAFQKTIVDLPLWKRTFITAVDTISYADADRFNIPLGRDLDGDGEIDEDINYVYNDEGKRVADYYDSYFNAPFDTEVWGVEFDWQTNFWYLPSIFKGLVLNINYTRMFSKTKYQTTIKGDPECIADCGFPWQTTVDTYIDSTRSGRAFDQPAHLMNVTLGYDYKNFSARVSYLYQGDRLTGVPNVIIPVTDSYSSSYERWDVTLKQRVNEIFEIYGNFSNLTSTPDRSIIGNGDGDSSRGFGSTTFVQYYGFTMDLGVRLKF